MRVESDNADPHGQLVSVVQALDDLIVLRIVLPPAARVDDAGDAEAIGRRKPSHALQGPQGEYVHPGEVLMRRDDAASEVCFIASGAVEVETAGQKLKLGRGEMFGQLSLLSRHTRPTQVTAISHSTLLVLDETRFRRLLERNEVLRAAVRESAERRGIRTEDIELHL